MINTTVEQLLMIIGQKEVIIAQQNNNLMILNEKFIEVQKECDELKDKIKSFADNSAKESKDG